MENYIDNETSVVCVISLFKKELKLKLLCEKKILIKGQLCFSKITLYEIQIYCHTIYYHSPIDKINML